MLFREPGICLSFVLNITVRFHNIVVLICYIYTIGTGGISLMVFFGYSGLSANIFSATFSSSN